MIFFAYPVVGVLVYVGMEAIRKVAWLEATNRWLEQREHLFIPIIRDMVVLQGTNFIHPVPGEYEVNFQTLRTMWAQMTDQEVFRAKVFEEFCQNFKVLEQFEIEHPAPEDYSPYVVTAWRWAAGRYIFLSDRIFG